MNSLSLRHQSPSARTTRILQGDCLELLATLPAESVDLICTDPPYGLGLMRRSWDTFADRKDTGGRVTRSKSGACTVTRDSKGNEQQRFSAFMTRLGSECLRVMKPGAFMFLSMTPRQDCLASVVVALEDAGLETGFTSLYWTYATGFPKAQNISRAAATRGRKGVQLLKGAYGGFQPKPAVEVIIVAMKPRSAKSFADQAIQNGKGVTWFDDCRAGRGGRFPANLIVSDEILGDHSSYFSLDQWAENLPKDVRSRFPFFVVPKASRREKDFGLEGMPAKSAAEVSGRKAGSAGLVMKDRTDNPYSCVSATSAKLNHHPTVKPLQLISYLITLGSRPGDVVLDPFLGSGTTAVAATMLGRQCIGFEREADYVAIAQARLRAMRKGPTSIPMRA